MKNTEEAYR